MRQQLAPAAISPDPLNRARRTGRGLAPIVGLIAVALLAAACTGEGGVLPYGHSPEPLKPAEPGADPVSLLAWLFTPIFQTLFIILVGVYAVLKSAGVPGAIGIAIIVLTLIVRAVLIPLFRRQLVSQRRMQMLQPEMAEIRRRYKGDAMKQRVAQQELMKERGVNPLAGCLPLLLQMPLLFIIYAVIANGLTSWDPRPMLSVGGIELVQLPHGCPTEPPPANTITPCIDTTVPWLFGLDISRPETTIMLFGFGISLLAILSAALQLVQSRMMLAPADPTNDDPNVRIQRQMMLFLPLITVLYGGILPAGLFIYWIVTTVFSIGQQYLIVGWGAMFPLLGWYPAFARDHTPRFPVAMPPPDPAKRGVNSLLGGPSESRAAAAKKTIRQRERGRQGRRGRRR